VRTVQPLDLRRNQLCALSQQCLEQSRLSSAPRPLSIVLALPPIPLAR
jgi:hypothetical protein